MDPLSTDGELRSALALAEVRGVGPERYRWLVDRYGSPRAALREGRRDARRGALPRALRHLSDARPAPPERLQGLRERGIRVTVYGGAGYPSRLAHLHHPPPVLYLSGPGSLSEGRAVAVVGTRKATGYGRRMARDLSGALAAAGWTVVSGMAAGIDGAAHRAALDAGGATVGVIGSGLEHRYPASNRDLYRSMEREGVLASEFAPEVPPAPGLFPRRNRIIAALAEVVVVVQAGAKSGALITASRALELGREVCGVPGPVGPPGSVGVHDLLRDGATPVTSAADVVEAAGGDRRPLEDDGSEGPRVPSRDRLAVTLGAAAGPAEELCRGLREGPRGTDDLATELDLPIPDAMSLLARLELEGWVRSLPGGRFELAPGPGGRDGGHAPA